MAANGGDRRKATAKQKARMKKTSKTAQQKPYAALRRLHDRLQPVSKLIPLLVSATCESHSFLVNHDLHLLPSQTLALESLLSSTSLSLSTLLRLLSLPLPPPHPTPPPTLPTTPWFQRFRSSPDCDCRWSEFFGVTKPSFALLLRLLSPSLSSIFPLPPDYALAATLFRLAHAASFSGLSRRFGFDSASTCRAFYTVCKAINDHLGHLFEFKSDINRIIVGFGWISLPNCCGALGIEKFELDNEMLGENGSLLVQALVDSEGRFLDVSAGWPGSVNPENILRQSKLFSGVEESKEYLNGPPFELSSGNSIPQYILGDSCFPLLPWLLTPYTQTDNENQDQLSSEELSFNSVHSKAMQLVGMAFHRVRARWKLVSMKWKDRCVEAFPFVVVACCLLHNFMIKCSEEMLDGDVENSSAHEFPVFDGEEDAQGKRIRDVLASHLNRVSHRR